MKLPVVWSVAAATDRRRITRYIADRSRHAEVAVNFMDRLMERVERLGDAKVLFRPGRVPGTREFVVHPNYIVVYRVNEVLGRVEIIRLWTVWKQPPR